MDLAGDELSTEIIDHHGIVAGICHELKLIERINSRIGSFDPRRIIQPGVAVVAMIMNGLGFTNRRLYLTPQFFETKSIQELFNMEIKAEQLNEHALGKCLDEIAEYGPTKLFGEIALDMLIEHKLLGKTAHLDSTSFSLSGNYETEEPAAIEVTYGFSKDHRPDLKQVMLSMVCTGTANVPMWMEPQNGNSSDKSTFHETLKSIQSFQAELGKQNEFLWIADSAFYTKEKIQNIQNTKWISRVPETIKECKNLVEQPENKFSWNEFENGYRYCEMESNYADVQQRWLLVFSKQAYEREVITFEKNLHSKLTALEKTCWHESNQVYNCELDAEKSLKKIASKEDFFIVTGQIIPVKKNQGAGRPRAGSEKITSGFKVQFEIARNEECIFSHLQTKGRFVLATNDLDTNTLTSEAILTNYKEQQGVERGFRFIKDPFFMVDSFFVKKRSRIMALMMIMTLSLFVYNFIQYKIRKNLLVSSETLPNQKDKEVQNPTTRWLFQLFEGVSVVKFYDELGRFIRKVITNLNPIRKKILQNLGAITCEIYGLSMANIKK